VGKPGIQIVTSQLPELKQKQNIHLTIANGENCASGKGLTPKTADTLFSLGIDIITTGNHIWNRETIIPLLDQNPFILRPLNYPPDSPGSGSCIIEIKQKLQIGVINLQGRSFMYSIDCPFRTANSEIAKMKKNGINAIIIDFHAEATAEKMALGWYLDGQVSALIGTHTHVQTADERILPRGTAYITDAGMTGPYNSVIGMEKEVAIQRFITQLPVHYKTAQGDAQFTGVIINLDLKTGKALSISRFQIIE
jgi:metallophosphoesterase (TIGR00282 family)